MTDAQQRLAAKQRLDQLLLEGLNSPVRSMTQDLAQLRELIKQKASASPQISEDGYDEQSR